MSESEQLDAIFSALAHPTRRAILAQLAEGEMTINTLAEPHEMSLPAISKHIHVLESSGLIRRRKNAQFRPCTLNIEQFKTISNWVEQYRSIWEARFEKMENILNKER